MAREHILQLWSCFYHEVSMRTAGRYIVPIARSAAFAEASDRWRIPWATFPTLAKRAATCGAPEGPCYDADERRRRSDLLTKKFVTWPNGGMPLDRILRPIKFHVAPCTYHTRYNEKRGQCS